MPNLQSFAVLDERVKKCQEERGLESLGIAFEWVGLEAVLKLNSIEVEDALVDDGMDGGIDAIWMTDDGVHVLTFTYASTFDNAKKNFPQDKLDALALTMQKVFNRTLTEADVNPAVWEKIIEIWNLFGEGPVTFHYHVCSNKEQPTDAAKERFEDALKPIRFMIFNYWDLEGLVANILEEAHVPVNGTLDFIKKSYFTKSDGPLKATVAAVAVSELLNLVKDPDDETKINEHVLNENIRVDLGLNNSINRGIFESALSETNYEFWYLNNGVTLVCDECDFSLVRAPTATLKNVRIVNGGQTTRTLFQASLKDKDSVAKVDVMVRIIETRDPTISEKIGEAANKQTPVRSRDLHANDYIQRKLEDQFKTLGYYYERKRHQYADKPLGERIDAEEIGQVALAYYGGMPSQAKDQKALVFSERYNDIFDEDTVTASRLLIPLKLYQPLASTKAGIQRRKRKKEEVSDRDAFVSLATFHILSTMKLVAEQEGLNTETVEGADRAREVAIELIETVVVRERESRGELYTHDRFFKQRGTFDLIANAVQSRYADV